MLVVITEKIHQQAIDLILKHKIKIKFGNDFRQADGIISLLTGRVGEEQLSAAKNLKIVSLVARGYDNVDIEYCKSRGIIVTNIGDATTHATADLAFALMMSTARLIPQSDSFVRAGKFKGWEKDLFIGVDLYGKTLGIIGAGRIGQEVARRSKGFEMQIIYFSKTRKQLFEVQTGAMKVSLEELLRKSDYISVNCPLNKETWHLLSDREFKNMKRNCVLVNTSRGPVVDEEALVKALKKKKIFGAGLDVYEREPKIHLELFKLPNVVLLPHIGSATQSTRENMAKIAAQNLVNVLHGRPPIFRVI